MKKRVARKSDWLLVTHSCNKKLAMKSAQSIMDDLLNESGYDVNELLLVEVETCPKDRLYVVHNAQTILEVEIDYVGGGSVKDDTKEDKIYH